MLIKKNNPMRNKLKDEIFKLSTSLTTDEKIALMNEVLRQLLAHFHGKADKSKRVYGLYKYGSIVLAAITTIISALQVIYPSSFPQWILPVASAGATVAVAFLGASGAQKIWTNSRTTQQHLQTEHFLFNQQAGRYHNLSKEDAVKIFSERMVELWDEGHHKWEQNVGDD